MVSTILILACLVKVSLYITVDKIAVKTILKQEESTVLTVALTSCRINTVRMDDTLLIAVGAMMHKYCPGLTFFISCSKSESLYFRKICAVTTGRINTFVQKNMLLLLSAT